MKFDAIIIGFGKGGKTLAGALAGKGKSVAMVEKSRGMYGGTCINVGCIPSKSLVTSAAEAALYPDEPYEARAERYAAAIAEKRRVTSMLRKKNYMKLYDNPNVTIFDGTGRFRSNTQVEVLLTGGGTQVLEGEHIFINTGATPVMPDIPGLTGNPYVYTSETLMEEDRLPRTMVLIGAGYIGMEFSSLYANFGTQVTVLQDGGLFLPREDRDVAEEVRNLQEQKGVRFMLDAKTIRVEGSTVVYERNGKAEMMTADAILVATGRRPNIDGLQLENAGIKTTPRGAVQVDSGLRTTAPNVWAMGDINGGQQFTFVSLDDYRIVLSQLTGGGKTLEERKNVPYSVFMDTPLGRVGITEMEAIGKGIPIKVMKLPTAAVPKAQVLRKTGGFLKAVVHAETGKILGVSLLCPEAYELVNTVKLAMDLDADYTVLRDRIYTHPTMTEAFNDLFSL